MRRNPKRPRNRYLRPAFITLILGIAGFFTVRQLRQVPPTAVCTRFKHVPIRGREPAWVGNGKYRWTQDTTIMVYFEAGVNPVTKKIIAIANEWHRYCNIKFAITPYRYEGMVKVSFEPHGYGSAIGKECIQPEYKSEPSMYLQDFDQLKDPVVFRRVVLHEFGHVLGIEHELSNPNAAIPWDSIEVYKFYQKNNHWDKATVNQEVFKTLQPDNKDYSEFDASSIMVYAIAPPLTKKDYVIKWPLDLSPTDKKYIGAWYPLKAIR